MLRQGVGRFALVGWLVLAASAAEASPVSYEFTGTLYQPYNGSTRFSGTLTYNTDLPTYPGIQPSPGWSYYLGVPNDPTAPVTSLAFQIGDTPSSSLGSPANVEVIVAHSASDDGFYVYESLAQASAPNLSAEFGIVNNNLVQRAPIGGPVPPASLNLADFSMGATLNLYGTLNGQWVNLAGRVDSLTPITTVPEPSSALVFVALGFGTVVFRAAAQVRKNHSISATTTAPMMSQRTVRTVSAAS
jgi:hypothetical protein